MVDSFSQRLRSHRELGHRLFWMEQATDETLLQLYSIASGLLMASEGEGFGLPLVEAVRHAVPIITRDLGVFREVAGEHAFYFSGADSTDLAGALRSWLELYRRGEHPKSSMMPWLTWQQSSQRLLQVVLEETVYRRWRRAASLYVDQAVHATSEGREGAVAAGLVGSLESGPRAARRESRRRGFQASPQDTRASLSRRRCRRRRARNPGARFLRRRRRTRRA